MKSKYDSQGLLKGGYGAGYGLGSITYLLTGSTTYSIPVGTRAILVEAIAPGGAGGSCSTAASVAAAGGGSGGMYARKLIASPAASYAVSVPSGGTAGATGANNGNAGGNTVFGASLAVAIGGLGGISDTATTTLHQGGLGGDSSPVASAAGDLIICGQPGGWGLAGPTGQVISGFGGQSGYGFGPGANSKKNATGAGGVPVSGYGGGGSGATIVSSGASQAGGAGAPGLITVSEFY